jgi:hypothetical protein
MALGEATVWVVWNTSISHKGIGGVKEKGGACEVSWYERDERKKATTFHFSLVGIQLCSAGWSDVRVTKGKDTEDVTSNLFFRCFPTSNFRSPTSPVQNGAW